MKKHEPVEPTPEYGDVKPLYINGVYVGDDAKKAEAPLPPLEDLVRQAFNNERQIAVCLELVRKVEHYAGLCQDLHARINTLEQGGTATSSRAAGFAVVDEPVAVEGSTGVQVEPITLTGDEPAPAEVEPVIPAP